MKSDDKVSVINIDELIENVSNMNRNGYRFVALTGVSIGEECVEVIYHFDKDFKMNTFKLEVSKNEKVPSISGIYFCAILAENEIKEMFGVEITDIVVDYGGRMLLANDFGRCAPMTRGQITVVKKEDAGNA